MGLSELKSRCTPGCIPSGGFRGESVPSPFPGSMDGPHSSAHGSFPPCSKPETFHFSDHSSAVTFSCDLSQEKVSTFEDPHNYTGPTQKNPGASPPPGS